MTPGVDVAEELESRPCICTYKRSLECDGPKLTFRKSGKIPEKASGQRLGMVLLGPDIQEGIQ